MSPGAGRIVFKDSTLREGLDVPGVVLTGSQRRLLVHRLAEAGVPEAEVVAPGHFRADLDTLKGLGFDEVGIRSSGLIYAQGPQFREQLRESCGALDRVDVLLPLSERRAPFERAEKTRCLREALRASAQLREHFGVGFPHATQVEVSFLLDLCAEAEVAGTERITLYDTNGSADPFAVADLVRSVRERTRAQVCFHAHNDLGMATANSVAAALAGAECLDVTVNGLGDRAGNASLEQVALALHARGKAHGLRLDRLADLSRAVASAAGIPVSPLAPVVGAYVFCHKSPSHLEVPDLFEAFDPALIGARRSTCTE